MTAPTFAYPEVLDPRTWMCIQCIQTRAGYTGYTRMDTQWIHWIHNGYTPLLRFEKMMAARLLLPHPSPPPPRPESEAAKEPLKKSTTRHLIVHKLFFVMVMVMKDKYEKQIQTSQLYISSHKHRALPPPPTAVCIQCVSSVYPVCIHVYPVWVWIHSVSILLLCIRSVSTF